MKTTSESTTDTMKNNIGQNLLLNQVEPSLTNPRKRFDEAELNELAASIRQHGVMQPILVRPSRTTESGQVYEIVAGERRYRASLLAGEVFIPAIIRELSDLEAMQLQIIENMQRNDLHPLEEAFGFKQLLNQPTAKNILGWSVDDLAEKVGKSRTYIYNSLKLTELCTYAQDAFYDGKLKRETAILIARIPGEKLQTQATKEITKPDQQGDVMSYRAAAAMLRERYMLSLGKAIFDTHTTSLVEGIGNCLSCPKRSGNSPELFPDVESADVCTDPDCYAAKRQAHIALLEAQGQHVIKDDEAKKVVPQGIGGFVSGGYCQAERYVYFDGIQGTYQDLLGDDMPQGTLIVDNKGNAGHVYLESDLKAKLQAKIESGELKVPEAKAEAIFQQEQQRQARERVKKAEEERRMQRLDELASAVEEALEVGGGHLILRHMLAIMNERDLWNDDIVRLNTLYQHTPTDEAPDIITKMLQSGANTDALLRLACLMMAVKGVGVVWGWQSPDDSEDDDDYKLFATLCRAFDVDPEAELKTAEPAPTPPTAAQASDEPCAEPAAPAVDDATLPAGFQKAKAKALAKKAKAKTQKESADADIQSNASTAAAAEENAEEAA